MMVQPILHLINIPNDENILLIKHTTNIGKRCCIKTGFEKSIELNSEITISIDADNQHDPNFIPKFIE